jgi:hypothetical protein
VDGAKTRKGRSRAAAPRDARSIERRPGARDGRARGRTRARDRRRGARASFPGAEAPERAKGERQHDGDDDDDGDGDASDAGVEPRERATRWERRTTTMRGARGGEDGSDARGGGERRGTRATGDDEARDERAGRARLGERTGRGTVETDDGG